MSAALSVFIGRYGTWRPTRRGSGATPCVESSILMPRCARYIGAPTGMEKKHRIYSMSFASVYPLYVQKAERKGRTKAEVDEVIAWLTGYAGAQPGVGLLQRDERP